MFRVWGLQFLGLGLAVRVQVHGKVLAHPHNYFQESDGTSLADEMETGIWPTSGKHEWPPYLIFLECVMHSNQIPDFKICLTLSVLGE